MYVHLCDVSLLLVDSLREAPPMGRSCRIRICSMFFLSVCTPRGLDTASVFVERTLHFVHRVLLLRSFRSTKALVTSTIRLSTYTTLCINGLLAQGHVVI